MRQCSEYCGRVTALQSTRSMFSLFLSPTPIREHFTAPYGTSVKLVDGHHVDDNSVIIVAEMVATAMVIRMVCHNIHQLVIITAMMMAIRMVNHQAVVSNQSIKEDYHQ